MLRGKSLEWLTIYKHGTPSCARTQLRVSYMPIQKGARPMRFDA
jgi:hypothetical protein